MPTDTPISLNIDIPEDLHQRIGEFLEANPTWHYDDFVAVALTTLLIQLGDRSASDARVYLDTMFYRLWGKAAGATIANLPLSGQKSC